MRDSCMKNRLLTFLVFITLVVLQACSANQPQSVDLNKYQFDETFIFSCMDTVVNFNHSDIKSKSSTPEIPPELWAVEIKKLKPLKVFYHNNNLALLFNESENEINGIYIYVPISSYLPIEEIMSLTVNGENYDFLVVN